VIHHHRRSNHRKYRRRARVFVAACAITALGLAIAAVVLDIPIPAQRATQSTPTRDDGGQAAVTDFAAALPPRPIYKYSVVDGGAYTATELTDAVNRDPIVADHYHAIDLEKVRAEIVNEERLAYMSYRRGSRIYWTKHKVRLRQGETILTDGATHVRSRCGNCISLEPMQPTADDEPDMVEFEALTDNPTAVPSLPSSPRAFTIPPGLLLPPPFGSASIDPTGPLAIGPIAQNLADTDLTEPGRAGEPGRPIDLFPVPPADLPPPDGSIPEGAFPPEPPSGPKEPPLIVVPPPFEPPIDVPEDFVPEEPLNPPDDTVPVPVPEPGTLLLIGSGILGLLAKRRRSS